MQIALTPARSQHPYSSSYTHTHSRTHKNTHPLVRVRARTHTRAHRRRAHYYSTQSRALRNEVDPPASREKNGPTSRTVRQRLDQYFKDTRAAHTQTVPVPRSVCGQHLIATCAVAAAADTHSSNHQPLSHGWQRARASAATVAHPTAEQQRSSQC